MAFPLDVSTVQAAYKRSLHNARIDIIRDRTRVDATPFRRIGRASSEQDRSLQLQESVSANAGVQVSPQIAWRHQGGARRYAGEGGLDLRSGHFLDTAIFLIHRRVAERACEARPQGFANFGIGTQGCRA
jgi:hypothetical protein